MTEIRTFREILAFCHATKLISLCCAGTALSAAITAFFPFGFGRFIDHLTGRGRNAWLWFVVIALVSGINVILKSVMGRRLALLSRQTQIRLQGKLLAHFSTLSPLQQGSSPIGEVGMKFIRDTEAVGQFGGILIPQLVSAASLFLFAMAFSLTKNIFTGLLMAIFALLQYAWIRSLGIRMEAATHTFRNMSDRTVGRFFESLHLFPFFKATAAETTCRAESDRLLETYSTSALAVDVSRVRYQNRLLALGFAGEFVILGISGMLAMAGRLSVGDVVFYQGLFFSFSGAFSGAFNLLPVWKSIKEGWASAKELLDKPSQDMEGNVNLNVRGEVDLSHLGFHYPNTDRKLIHDVCVRMPAGSLVGISGDNGTGKTTFLKLLMGYMRPTEGRICIDGTPLDELHMPHYRSQIAAVFQEFLIRTGTLRENLTLGDANITDADIQKALRLSGADSVVARFSKGLLHFIGEDGGGLSGGEMQKMAIARALLRHPKILLLDEVMNHLDNASKERMTQYLLSVRGKVTVILVSHDRELLTLCDQVLSFGDPS